MPAPEKLDLSKSALIPSVVLTVCLFPNISGTPVALLMSLLPLDSKVTSPAPGVPVISAVTMLPLLEGNGLNAWVGTYVNGFPLVARRLTVAGTVP